MGGGVLLLAGHAEHLIAAAVLAEIDEGKVVPGAPQLDLLLGGHISHVFLEHIWEELLQQLIVRVPLFLIEYQHLRDEAPDPLVRN